MKIVVNGNLVSDPKVVSAKLTTLTVAENAGKEGEEKTTYVELKASGKAIEAITAANCKKGDLVEITGHAVLDRVKEGEKYFNTCELWVSKVEVKFKKK